MTTRRGLVEATVESWPYSRLSAMTNSGRFLPGRAGGVASGSGRLGPRLMARSGVVYLDSTPGFGPGRGGSTPPPGTPEKSGKEGDKFRRLVICRGDVIESHVLTRPRRSHGQGVRVPG